MTEANSPNRPATDFTSASLRKLIGNAEGILGSDSDAADFLDAATQLLSSDEDLPPEQRQQIEELARLLQAGPDAAGISELLSRDGSCEVVVADDAMSATMTFVPPVAGGGAVDAAQAAACLGTQGVTRGIDQAALAAALKRLCQGEAVEQIVIARGQVAQSGQDERLELSIREQPDATLTVVSDWNEARDENGAERNWFCEAGDVILRRIHGTSGEWGYTVRGAALEPPEFATVSIESGLNVRVEQDAWIAETAGLIVFDGARLEVRRVLVLADDVTSQQGPVEFDGDIHLRAAARNGAVIRATGNVRIDGLTGAAHVESTGGNIDLRHGVAGKHRAIVQAAGDVMTRFAESVTISAGRDIVVQAGSLHSQLIAGRAVRLVQGRGQFIGGMAMAGELVEVRQLGTAGGVLTKVHVGLSRQQMEEVGEIDQQAVAVRRRNEQATELADRIKRAIGDPAKLKPMELNTYTSLRQVQLVSGQQLKQLEGRRGEILETATADDKARIEVHESVMPQVVIRIGNAELLIEEAHHRSCFTYDPDTETLLHRSK